VAIEQEVSEIIEAAAAGDFSRRIVCDDKQGFFLKLSGRGESFTGGQ
jgi:methyl-accepting chemotaxis protein